VKIVSFQVLSLYSIICDLGSTYAESTFQRMLGDLGTPSGRWRALALNPKHDLSEMMSIRMVIQALEVLSESTSQRAGELYCQRIYIPFDNRVKERDDIMQKFVFSSSLFN
jgi:hypothetical protein